MNDIPVLSLLFLSPSLSVFCEFHLAISTSLSIQPYTGVVQHVETIDMFVGVELVAGSSSGCRFVGLWSGESRAMN